MSLPPFHLVFQVIMRKHVRFSGLLLCFLCASLSALAQSRAELEKRRQVLEKQITETNTLLRKSQKEKKATVSTLQTLKSEISMREELVGSLKQELDLLNSDLSSHEQSLKSLEITVTTLRKNHASQMKSAFIEQQMNHPVLYVLSARSLNEAFLRVIYRRQILLARKRTYEELRATTQEIETELSSLAALKEQKEDIAEDVEAQESELKESAERAQAMVSDLEKKERSLVRQLEQHKKESKALADEIEKIIAAEVKKSAEGTNLPAAPVLKALSVEFARNKGKLPWPVDHGAVTSRFGTQPHPVVKSITVSNNGIDITAPSASAVRAIFGGKVVGRKFIPGFDHMVIIQHGSYYSVYSRLEEVTVELNQEVSARDIIGRLAKDAKENPRLHLEIWENKKQLNPELWISR